MFLAINILALLLVVGMCWTAMVWYSGRFHRVVDETDGEVHYVALPVDTPGPGAPCIPCEGVGATSLLGRLAPCPACQGTGVTG